MKKIFTRMMVLTAALTFSSVAMTAQETDYTSYIVNADLTGTNGWNADGTKGIDGSGIVKCGNNAVFDFSQTIANLPAGQYKLTAKAAYRYSGSEQDEYDAMQTDAVTKNAKLYATVGEETVSTLVMNRYDGASTTDYANGSGSVMVNGLYVPNSSNAVKAWFEAGQYVNEVTFDMPADGSVTIGIAKSAQPEVGDYTVIGPWTLTRLGDVPGEAQILEQTIDHERMAGQGYTPSIATVDFTAAKEFLGVDVLNTGMLYIEKPNGELILFNANNGAADGYDGWFNGEGAPEKWGSNTKVCVKFFQAIPDGKFEICDMNGADEVGKTYTVKWQLVNGEKAVRYTINVNFIPYVQPVYTPEIIGVVDVDVTMKPATAYEGSTAMFDAAEIATMLGLGSLADADEYIVNVTDGNFVDNTTDGWRNADGDAATWGSSAGMVCVKCNNPASGTIDYLGAIDDTHQEGATYTAKWGFVNAEEKAVVLRVNILFTDGVADGIAAVEGTSAPVQVFNLAGQKVEKAVKGLYIVNGRKVVMK